MARGTTCRHVAGLSLLGAVLLVLHQPQLYAKDPKMKAEELVAKHLESIGSAEARAAAKNRVANGTAQVTFHLPIAGKIPGKGSVLSDGRKVRISMMFSAQDSDQLVFDGNKVDVGQLQLRQRSTLSDLVYHYDVLLKEGLMGGTMTTAWPLLDLTGRQPKLDYTGLKKVKGQPLHELKYRAKNGADDLQIALYFDPATYRHVYSQYRLALRAGVGSRGAPSMSNIGTASPADQMDVFYRIEEWFDDFRTVDSLNLPHVYRLSINREGPSPLLYEYGVTLSQILHNQEMDPKTFVIQ